jgi:hypothetical protein
MNSRRTIFLLAFFVFFISGVQIATAVPRSDDPMIQEIFNKWADRDKANKRLFIKCNIEYFFIRNDELRQVESGGFTLAIDGQKFGISYDVMPHRKLALEMSSKVSIDGEYKRFLDLREPSFLLRFFGIPKFSHGTIRPLDKKSSTFSVSRESAVTLAYCPMRFFFKNSYQLTKARIVARDLDIDGRKCLKLEIPRIQSISPRQSGGRPFITQNMLPDKKGANDTIKLKSYVWVEQSSRHLPYRYQDFDEFSPRYFIDINYEFMPDGSWKLAKWKKAQSPDGRWHDEITPVELTVNEFFDPELIDFKFPPGTFVDDFSNIEEKKKGRKRPDHYYILENGEKSTRTEAAKKDSELRRKMVVNAFGGLAIILGTLLLCLAGLCYSIRIWRRKRRAKKEARFKKAE